MICRGTRTFGIDSNSKFEILLFISSNRAVILGSKKLLSMVKFGWGTSLSASIGNSGSNTLSLEISG